MQQIFSAIALLPPFLIFLAIVLVIVPTIFTILLRYRLYQHLNQLDKSISKLLRGYQPEEHPAIINKLNQRLQENSSSLEQINTTAMVEGVYSQEKFKFLGKSLDCESVNYFCRILPNLLLSFGLLGKI